MHESERASGLVWRVGCRMAFDVGRPATFALQVAPAAVPGDSGEARLDATVDGRALDVRPLAADHHGRVHVVACPAGRLEVAFDAVVERPPTPAPAPAPASPSSPRPELDLEQLTYLRQSRYCPSDRMSGFVAYELGHLRPGAELLSAVADWVGSRLTYEEGASGPLDSAIDSLFHGRGVCRDFAHLAISVLRALEVPARLVAVYAPGLSPMDFHAVVEAHVDGCWQVLDATRLAPRPSLLRVATGRDAADTAFVTVLGGEAELLSNEVVAVVDGELPIDDHQAPVAIL